MGELSCCKAHYAAERLTSLPGVRLAFDRPYFKEFALRCDDLGALVEKARRAGFDLGPELSPLGVHPHDALLVAVTEQRTREEIDRLAELLTR